MLGLQLVLSKTNRNGDTKSNTKFSILLWWEHMLRITTLLCAISLSSSWIGCLFTQAKDLGSNSYYKS